MKILPLGTCKAGLAVTALIWITLSPLAMQGQVAGASLSGTVSDPSGAPLVGVKLAVENVATGISRETTTDGSGLYTAPNLLPGTYQITVSAPGFKTQVRKGITLTVGGQSTLNFEMGIGNIRETVEVTEEAPLVQSESSDISAVVNATGILQWRPTSAA